jgi:hypothetical protein
MLFSIFITILVASFSVQIATADDGVVLQGIVLDSLSKRPIPGVAIRAKGASIGT